MGGERGGLGGSGATFVYKHHSVSNNSFEYMHPAPLQYAYCSVGAGLQPMLYSTSLSLVIVIPPEHCVEQSFTEYTSGGGGGGSGGVGGGRGDGHAFVVPTPFNKRYCHEDSATELTALVDVDVVSIQSTYIT